jgi:hypothetical protein
VVPSPEGIHPNLEGIYKAGGYLWGGRNIGEQGKSLASLVLGGINNPIISLPPSPSPPTIVGLFLPRSTRVS